MILKKVSTEKVRILWTVQYMKIHIRFKVFIGESSD